MPIINRFPFCTEKIVDGTNIFGVSWDGSASTAWTRTDTAASFPEPVPYKQNATTYKSKFDKYLPWRGIVKEEISGVGTCVKIPKFWYKLTANSPGFKIQIADYAASGFSVSPAHMDRGDGKGVRDYVYVGRYKCTTNAYKSVTGTGIKRSVTRTDSRAGIHNLGATVWQMDFTMIFTIWLLYLVEIADWDSQAKIGYGGVYSNNNNSTNNQYNTGYSDSIPYHTGTTKTTAAAYGVVHYRWIEDLWGQAYEYLDGCYSSKNGLNIILNPTSFSDNNSGGIVAGACVSGFPTAFTVYNPSGLYPIFLPTTAGGSNTTYSTDKWVYNSTGTAYQWFVGNGGNQSLNEGLFSIYAAAKGTTSSGMGCRLMILP